MKEVVITAPHQYEIREVPIPELENEEEVLIQMKAAGVCGTDHHIYHGLNPCSTYPRIPGHENAGIVVKTGENVTNVRPGDHVVVDLLSACGSCYPCRIGRKNICTHVKVRGSGADGGFREYFTAPSSEVYKIDNRVDWKDAALIEPYAIGAHCTQRGRVTSKDVVFILGAGTIGSIILQTCKAKGCQKIICCDVDGDALHRALAYGADVVIRADQEDIAARISGVTGGEGVTIAFDSACYPGSLTLCMQQGVIGNAGRMVPLGFCTKPENLTQAIINQREIDIIGTRMSAFQFPSTIQRMEQGELNTNGIVTSFIPFQEIEKVFAYMENPVPESKKMVILF